MTPDVLLRTAEFGAVTPFFVACARGHARLASYLYRCGFNTERAAPTGTRARELAQELGHAAVLQVGGAFPSWARVHLD
jgi:hypothetical protein